MIFVDGPATLEIEALHSILVYATLKTTGGSCVHCLNR